MEKKKQSKSFSLKNYFPFILVGGLLLYGILAQNIGGPKMFGMSTANLFVQIGYYIILAVSLNLVVGFLGELSLGHAGFMCIGAYLGGFIAVTLKESGKIESKLLILLISMLAAGVAAAIFGFIVGLPALRLKGDYLAIVTLAFGEIVRTICKNLFGAMGYSTGSITYDTRKDISLYIVALVTCLVVLFFILNLVRSKHGRAITAIRDNEIAAKAMGINVTYYKLLVFVISAAFAGMAGVFYAHSTTPVLYSFFSYNKSIEILVMVVLGGMASVNGSIIAAAVLTIINVELQAKLTGDLAALKYLIYALILIIMVIYNNAPKLAGVREKLSFGNIMDKKKMKKNPGHRTNDDAEWSVIPSKIEMDEILSVEVQQNSPYDPEKPKKEGKGDE